MNGPQQTAVSRKESWQKLKHLMYTYCLHYSNKFLATGQIVPKVWNSFSQLALCLIFELPLNSRGATRKKNQHWGTQLEHTPRLYTKGQTTACTTVNRKQWTRQADRQTDRQGHLSNLILVPAVNSLCETMLHKLNLSTVPPWGIKHIRSLSQLANPIRVGS